MKTQKALLLAYTALLYLCLGAFVTMTVFAFVYSDAPTETYDKMINIPAYSGVALAIIAIIFGFFVVLSALLAKEKLSYKFLMVIKMVLIPYYVANFVLWILYGIGFFLVSPFLLAVFIFVGIVFTYLTLVTTSGTLVAIILPDLKSGRLNRLKLIGCAIGSFFYLIDVVASVFLYKEDKRVRSMVKPVSDNVIDGEAAS